VLGADARAFADKRAAPDGVVLGEDREAVFGALIAGVEIVTLGESDSGGAGKKGVEPVDRAGGVAKHAVDAHAVLLEGFELFGSLQILAFGDGLFFLTNEPGLHFLELAHEVVHSDDEVADDGKIAERLDANGRRRVIGEESGAGELWLAVDEHAATAADAHATGPAIGEGAVLLILYVVERVEDDPIAAEGNFEALETRSGVSLRRVARDFEFDGVGHDVLTCAGFLRRLSVNTFAGRPPRDPDGEILDAGASIGGAEYQGVGEKFLVVAPGEIAALVGAAGFGAEERGLDHGFGDVEHEGEFEGGDEVSVEGEGMIVEREIVGALLKFAEGLCACG
jgi:hypothetical protein